MVLEVRRDVGPIGVGSFRVLLVNGSPSPRQVCKHEIKKKRKRIEKKGRERRKRQKSKKVGGGGWSTTLGG